jgi:hypothetical protein
MFPPGEFCEWDLDRAYSVETIEVYAILNQVAPHGKTFFCSSRLIVWYSV